jgi:DNA mismatch repair ATPase MutS
MSFTIDKQTLEELNLMGKFKHGSVYGLFSKVKTAGGQRLLNDMFNHPLEDINAINTRSAIFRSFQDARLAFPFDPQQIGLMRDHLDAAAAKSALFTLVTLLKKKWMSLLIRDERYKQSIQGLQATIGILNRCYTFVSNSASLTGPFADRLTAVRSVLSDKRLEKLRNTDIYKAIPLSTLAFYDHLLKGGLHSEMQEILNFIAELDVYITVGEVARTRDFHYAKALSPEQQVFSAKGLRHPCIDGAVGNEISLYKGNNMLFLTGANMAGKSTLMKSVGIALYLAHMGFPVAAAQLDFSVREGIYSSINVADNINLGYSHFYAEVVRVKQAAEATAAGKKLLLMFDELFKGTNVKDAYDGTLAVTKAFSAYEDCLFIVSTHIIEVGEALESLPNIQFAYMPTVMDGTHPRYTYQLKEGITEDRQGMMIIRNEGILDLLKGKTMPGLPEST